MSYNQLELFLRRIARLLYTDDITPILIDHLLDKKIAEDYSLANLLKIEYTTVK